MATRTITVFLASSDELKNDRNSFSDLIRSLDNIYEPRGIRIKLQKWEDFFAYCTGTRTQDQYNQVLSGSDMCICLFHKRAGQYTLEEFHHAMAEYQRTGDHPKTYVYARALVDGEIEAEELVQFKKDLFDKMGHYWCNYATEDSMKLHFVMQFEHLLNGENVRGLESNIKVERGNVLLYGKKVADYTNIPFAANNADIKALQANIVSLNNQIAKLRAEDASLNIINPIVEKRNEYQKQLDQLEKQLLDMAISINKTISSGEPINERKRRAIEMFEKGNHKEVDRILNAEDIKADCKRSKNRIALIEQKRAEFDALMAAEKEAEIQRLRSSVDDYILKAKNIMTMYSNPNRFNEACHWYEEAIQETRSGLPEVDLAQQLLSYSLFLYHYQQYHSVESRLVQALDIYQQLADSEPQRYLSWIALVKNNLAAFYHKQLRLSEADIYSTQALEIYQQLAQDEPQTYLSFVAQAKNNLASICADKNHSNDAERYYKEALEIYLQLAQNEPLVYLPSVALAKCNLNVLYLKTNRLNEAEVYSIQALEIYQQLAVNEPQAYMIHVATAKSNLAGLYADQKRYTEAEQYYKEALEIYQQLAQDEPLVYMLDEISIINNLAVLYTRIECINEAELYSIQALEMCRQLSKNESIVYMPEKGKTLSVQAEILSRNKRYVEAEQYFKMALEIYEELSVHKPHTYMLDMTRMINNLAALYVEMGCINEAEVYSTLALEKCNQLSKIESISYLSEKCKALHIQADILSRKKCYIEAEQNYQEALKIYQELADDESHTILQVIAHAKTEIGYLYYNMQRWTESEQFYKEALEIYKQLDYDKISEYLAVTLHGLGILYIATACRNDAVNYLYQALDIYQKLAQEALSKKKYRNIIRIIRYNIGSNHFCLMLNKYLSKKYVRIPLYILVIMFFPLWMIIALIEKICALFILSKCKK